MVDLHALAQQAPAVLAALLPLVLWGLFWLLAVNWRKAWPVLAEGGWAPVVLLGVTATLVWSRLVPSSGSFFGLAAVPNFWWQLAAVAGIIGAALLGGWLQGLIGWVPLEVDVGPPPGAADLHGHEHPVGTLHGHDEAHADEPDAGAAHH